MRNLARSFLQAILGFLAQATLRRFKPGIIGVTGSVGKTSTKEAIRAVVSSDRTVRAPAKSFNNEIGLPLTILGDWRETGGIRFWCRVLASSLAGLAVGGASYPEVLVLEYGVDRPHDMEKLLRIAQPHVGVFTAMGEVPVHVEFFAEPEGVLREKAKLFANLPAAGFAVLNADDPQVAGVREATRAQVVTFGFENGADVRVSGFSTHLEGADAHISFKLSFGGSTVPLSLRGTVGRGEAYAAAAAAAVGSIFGMNLLKVADAMGGYEPSPGRSRVIRGLKGSVLIDGTYNASPAAMREALEALQGLRAKRKIAVLGDMLELGKYTLSSHERVGVQAAKCADLIMTIGLRGKLIAEAALKAKFPKGAVRTFMDLPSLGAFLQAALREGDLVLLKASQGVRLERVVEEVMAEPARAAELLARQNEEWLRKKGLYDEGE